MGVAQWQVMHFRTTKAEGNFWANSSVFMAPAPIGEKLAAWCRGPRTSALFGSINWHLTSELLHNLWSWELKWLRRCLRLRRRPTETFVEFLVRTSDLVKSSLARHGHKPIHVHLLILFYRSAFQEGGSGEGNLVLNARMFRSRIMWEAVKDMPAKRRKLDRFLQRSTGLKVYWEDVLVSFMGLDWRSKRACMTWRNWLNAMFLFLSHTCSRWNLNWHSSVSEDVDESPAKKQRFSSDDTKDRLVFRGDAPEADELLDTVAPLVKWSFPKHCFLYVTDSQSLQRIVCGHARLIESQHQAIISRVATRIAHHFACSWTPPEVWDDPVCWMARCHNKTADGLADLTMDLRRSWTKSYPHTMDAKASNLIVQTDGGLRDGDCAAAAWIIGVWGDDGQGPRFQPVVAGGTFLISTCTVFLAEAIALDEASAEVDRLILQCAQ